MRHQDREGKPFFTDNHEVNDLVGIYIKKRLTLLKQKYNVRAVFLQ